MDKCWGNSRLIKKFKGKCDLHRGFLKLPIHSWESRRSCGCIRLRMCPGLHTFSAKTREGTELSSLADLEVTILEEAQALLSTQDFFF